MIRTDCLPELAAAWQATARDAAAQGIAIAIADEGGTRTPADTARILSYKQDDYNTYAETQRAHGRTPLPITGKWDTDSAGRPSSRPVASFGSSFHDYGAARDFKVTAKPKGISTAAAMAKVQAIAKTHGLRSLAGIGDSPHLELSITLSDAKQRWSDYINRRGRYASLPAQTVATNDGGGAPGSAALPFLAGIAIVALVVIVGRALHG